MPCKDIIINFPNVLLPHIYNVMYKYINIFGQGLGILFRSVKCSVLLSLLTFKPVLCYEIFRKWPPLSLLPGCLE